MAQDPLPGQGWKDTRGNSCPLPGAGVWPVCEHLGPLGGQWGPPVVHRLSAFLSGSRFSYLSKGAPVDWGWEAWDGTYSVTHLDLGAAHKVFLFGGPRQGRGGAEPAPAPVLCSWLCQLPARQTIGSFVQKGFTFAVVPMSSLRRGPGVRGAP